MSFFLPSVACLEADAAVAGDGSMVGAVAVGREMPTTFLDASLLKRKIKVRCMWKCEDARLLLTSLVLVLHLAHYGLLALLSKLFLPAKLNEDLLVLFFFVDRFKGVVVDEVRFVDNLLLDEGEKTVGCAAVACPLLSVWLAVLAL